MILVLGVMISTAASVTAGFAGGGWFLIQSAILNAEGNWSAGGGGEGGVGGSSTFVAGPSSSS